MSTCLTGFFLQFLSQMPCAETITIDNMADKGEKVCTSCSAQTKYSCLDCHNHFCMRCCVYEDDEETPGWRMGSSVSRGDDCFREKMENEQERDPELFARESQSETNASLSSGCSGRETEANSSFQDTLFI